MFRSKICRFRDKRLLKIGNTPTDTRMTLSTFLNVKSALHTCMYVCILVYYSHMRYQHHDIFANEHRPALKGLFVTLNIHLIVLRR